MVLIPTLSLGISLAAAFCVLVGAGWSTRVEGAGTSDSGKLAEVVPAYPKRLDHLGSVRPPQCPITCACTATTWDCSHANLTKFPRGIPKNIMALNLFNNQIPSIPVGEISGFPLLRVLDVRNNSITKLHKGTVVNCSALETIFLSFNLVDEISPLAFSGLPFLRTLRLDHNRLTRLVTQTFDGAELPRIKEIRLRVNPELSKIEPGTFYHLKSLRRIQMYRTNISTDVFGSYDMLTAVAVTTFAPGCDALTDIELGVLKLRALYPNYFHSNDFLRIVNRVGQNREIITTDVAECDSLATGAVFTDSFGAFICIMSPGTQLVDAPSRREKSHLPQYQEGGGRRMVAANFRL